MATVVSRKRVFELVSTESVFVYMAGAVVYDPDNPDDPNGIVILPWREDIFGEAEGRGAASSLRKGYGRNGRFVYGGPDIYGQHGMLDGSIVPTCRRLVAQADILFAWIDRETYGTLAEIGIASAFKLPIFVAFASKELSESYYFARDLSSMAIIAPDHRWAWLAFKQWANHATFDDSFIVGPQHHMPSWGWS